MIFWEQFLACGLHFPPLGFPCRVEHDVEELGVGLELRLEGLEGSYKERFCGLPEGRALRGALRPTWRG